jgi:hypothetical protein
MDDLELYSTCAFSEPDAEDPNTRVPQDFANRYNNIYDLLANAEFKPWGF